MTLSGSIILETSDMPPKLTATLQLDAFVRSIAINAGRPMSLLLGAGASISSGMPSAERSIWEWKQDIFATNNPTLQEVVGEISLPAARKRIQDWLDARGGFPAYGAVDEYSFYANACYPTPRDRRGFFQGYVTKAKPYLGYQLLPLLVRNDIVRTVWTTNFDGLPIRAFLEPRDYAEYLNAADRPALHLLRILPSTNMHATAVDKPPVAPQQGNVLGSA